jgi:hypothetical protein
MEEGCTSDCDVCRSLRQALLDALESDGLPRVEAAGVAAGAGLTEADLVEHYGGLAGCLAATYDELSDELYDLHVDAFDGAGDWRSRFLAGFRAALDRIASTPGAVCLFFADEVLGTRAFGPAERRPASASRGWWRRSSRPSGIRPYPPSRSSSCSAPSRARRGRKWPRAGHPAAWPHA